MNKFFMYFSLIVFILFFSMGCETTEQDAVEEIPVIEATEDKIIEFKPGTWEGQEFSSEWFGFRYRPTQGMIVTSEQELKDINATLSMNFDGPDAELYDYSKMQIAYEVMAKSGDGSITVEVSSEKIFADDLTVEQYAEIIENSLRSVHGRNVDINDITTVRLGNSDYVDISAIIDIDGQTKYQTVLLSQKEDRFAIVSFNFEEESSRSELLQSFTSF